MISVDQTSSKIESKIEEKEARLDIRLNKKTKDILNQVYKSAGYRSLSAFILQAAVEKAENFIEKENLILASERDRDVFFNALINTAEPNDALNKASKAYKKLLN
ncbi:MAG: DUF1778 domain-containing protein [Saprospiraceae bacterium]|nr:DUF1778 domain-containing protein [Saprospiraceae bacterium]